MSDKIIEVTFNGARGRATFGLRIGANNVNVAGDTFTIVSTSWDLLASTAAKFVYSQADRASFSYSGYIGIDTTTITPSSQLHFSRNSSNTTATRTSGNWNSLPYDGTVSESKTYETSEFFNDSNPTTRELPIYLLSQPQGIMSMTGLYFRAWKNGDTSIEDYCSNSSQLTLNVSSLVLNVPPTATVGALSGTTGSGYYADVTSVYVPITDLTAYYGGNFTDGQGGVTLEIGNQTSTIHADGTLVISPLNAVGTFTPKVTVTDSRGQTYVETLDPITVTEYKPTANILNLQRINATGEPEDDPDPGKASDEGTNAVIACQFDYPTISNNYMQEPIVKINGASPINMINWYTSWTESGGFSGQVSFSNYNPTRPITLYGKIADTLTTGTSYEISVACDTTLAPGNYDFKLLPQAFYLLSAPEGGHGLGIGRKVPVDAEGRGLHVGMDAIFYENVIFQKMAGMIQMFAGSTAPTGWLICDGSAVSRTTYATLFSVIGTTYGTGDGSTTFNLPDLRGRMPLGSSSSHGLASTGGSEYLQDHAHSGTYTRPTVKKSVLNADNITGGGHTHKLRVHADTVASGSKYDRPNSWASGQAEGYTSSNVTHTHSVPQHAHTLEGGGYTVNGVQTTNHAAMTTGDAGNMPPFLTINYIIATGRFE